MNIFKFIFSDGNTSEKFGLVRNVISLYINDELDKVNNECWNAIRSNYNIYLKENVQQYLEIKNKLTDFILDSVSKTNDILDGFVDSFKKNIVGVFVFFISIFLVNGLKDKGVSNLITCDTIIVLIAVSIISIIWLIMSLSDVKNKLNHKINSTKEILFLNYGSLFERSELESCINPALKKNEQYIHKQISKYKWCWVSMIVVIFILFVIGLLIKTYPEFSLMKELVELFNLLSSKIGAFALNK